MKNRISLFLLGMGLLAGSVKAQPPRIVVQGAGAPQVFSTINAALAAAQPNDRLYFSGGTFISPTQLVIDKPLHFIGAGINPDSTAVTGVTTLTTSSGDIVITTPAAGSTFTGLALSAAGSEIYFGLTIADDDPTGIIFERCRFSTGLVLGRNAGVTSTTFEECIFNHHVYGANTGANFNRCIFDYQTGTSSAINSVTPLEISHCVFLGVQAFRNSGSAYMENSISVYAGAAVYQSSSSTVTNCLFTHTALVSNSSGVISTNNQFGVAAASIFVNQVDLDYQFSDDLHMAVGSPGLAWANDGTDAGIYGSGTPYKPGNVPFNPHSSTAVIAGSTNANSELPVNIRVIAQPN